MAGSEIYIGKMLEAFNAKMDTFSADMAESVEAMRAVEARITEVAMNTSQAVDSVSIGIGNDHTVFLDSMNKTYQAVEGTTRNTDYILLASGSSGAYGAAHKIGEFSSNADGYAKINFIGVTFSAKVSSANTFTIGFFVNDGETEKLLIETDPVSISKSSSYANTVFPAKSGTFAFSAKKNYTLSLKVKKTTSTDSASLQLGAGAAISSVNFPKNLIKASYNLINKVSEPLVAIQ